MGNSATRPTDKCRMVPGPVRDPGAVTFDGVSLFDIVPTVTGLVRGVVVPLRAIWHNMNITE